MGRAGFKDSEDTSIYTWTVDVESDWGGRTNEHRGITQGLPVIIDTFKQHSVTPIFFVSTEIISNYPNLIEELRKVGEVGSHGHFHKRFEPWRAEKDKNISLKYFDKEVPYRAPWFSHRTEDRYSQKEGHVSVLKYSWGFKGIPENPIFYIHPFDIVGEGKAPSLFTKILYSRPQNVLDTFKRLVRLYPYSPKKTAS